jgi:hypothetical protein
MFAKSPVRPHDDQKDREQKNETCQKELTQDSFSEIIRR